MSDPFYRSATWKAIRARVLAAHPVCVALGCDRRASHVDHIRPRSAGGSDHPTNLRALCASCHNRRTARGNADLQVPGCHENGTPRDPRHWWSPSGGTPFVATEDAKPKAIKPSGARLRIVCGPAGAGKSTLVLKSAAVSDIVIDLDQIMAQVSGLGWYQADKRWLDKALARRNELLNSLSRMPKDRNAWFIVSAPRASDRAFWIRALKPDRTIIIATPLSVCLDRLQRDERRKDMFPMYSQIARRWWSNYSIGWASDVVDGTSIDKISDSYIATTARRSRAELVSPLERSRTVPTWD
jgi:hypothetical protein